MKLHVLSWIRNLYPLSAWQSYDEDIQSWPEQLNIWKFIKCQYLTNCLFANIYFSSQESSNAFFVYNKWCRDLKPMAKRQWMTKCSVWYLSENDIHYLQINILCIESCAERSGAIQAVTQFPISISTFWHQLNNQLRIKQNINWIKILCQIRIVEKRMIYILYKPL